ncbi:MAG: hypothetical protein JST61_15875 [Acidobacteria bacterium]|nr:hypothetical protein [Acidobacteriota bacterium]
MTDEERADLAENVYLYGRAKAAKMHNLPEFVIDLCRRWHIADLMDDPELVTSIRRIVHGTARFIDGVRRASKYLSLSIYATKAVLARTNHAVAATAKVQKFELSAEARLLVERAVEGLQSAGDPMFRELTVESAADHLLELMTAAANHVSDTVGESDHLSTREFPTPQTKAFAKSVRLLAWMWRVFAALDRESVRLLGDEIGWLIDCLKRNVAGRKQRQKDAIEKANRGLNVKSGGRPSDRFTWKQPALDHNAGAAVLKAGHCEMEVLLAAAA